MKDDGLKIEYESPDDLTAYADNPRTHSDEQVAQIIASMKEYGFTNPILIDNQNQIIAGHGRLLAAQHLRMETVPTIRLEGLTDEQRRAYVIADNKLALNAGWDEDLLAIEIEGLTEQDFDISLTGFSDEEIKDLMFQANAEEQGFVDLPSGDKEPFRQITFTLHDDQAEQVQAAMSAAKAMGAFVDSPNENSNGNAIARVCEMFLEGRT